VESRKVSSVGRVTEVAGLYPQPAYDRPSDGEDDPQKRSKRNSLTPRRYGTLAISRCQNCGVEPVWIIEKLVELDFRLWKLRETQNSP